MNNYLYIFCFIYLWLCSIDVRAQLAPKESPLADLYFEVVELPGIGRNINIEAIVQDSIGYMWFGTGQGLVRYDGYRTKIYTHDPGDPHSISSNDIAGLHVDPKGDLWIGTYDNGFNRMDPQSENFYRYLPGHPIVSIRSDPQGNIWTGGFGSIGLYRLDLQSDSITLFQPVPGDTTSLTEGGVWSLLVNSAGDLYVATSMFLTRNRSSPQTGINRFVPENEQFIRYGIPEPLSLLEDTYDHIWAGTASEGLFRMNPETGEIATVSLNPPVSNEIIRSLMSDLNNKLWVGTLGNGLYYYDPESGEQIYFKKDQETGGLPNDVIWRMYQSRDSVYWVGTGRRGNQLFKFYDRPKQIHHQLLGNLRTFAFAEDTATGNVWIGTTEGLVLYNLEQGIVRHYRHNPEDHSNNLPANGSITNILMDRQSKLWLSIARGDAPGLYHFDPKKEEFTRYRHQPDNPSSISQDTISDILEDSKGRLWIATKGGGLNRFDPQNESFRHYRADPGDPASLSHDFTEALYEDDQGIIWIGARHLIHGELDAGFLNRFDPEKESFSSTRLPISQVSRIHQDDRGDLWISTRSGLIHFDPESKAIQTFNSGNSDLPADMFMSSAMDKNHQIWLYSGFAVYQFSPESRSTTRVLRLNEEAPDLGPMPGAISALLDGSILIGSRRSGFGLIPPDQMQSSNSAELKIVDFRLLNRQPDEPEANSDRPAVMQDFKEKLVLTYDQNSFAFRFFMPDYRDPSSNRFEYKLENYEESWRQSGNQPEAVYYLLPPGDYTLLARMTGIRGNSSNPLALPIKILAPWWQRWWAYAIYVVLFALGVFGVDTFQKTRLIKMERERTRDRELAQAKEIERAYEQLGISHENLKNTQSQLIQSEKMASLGELTAGIAHEIQNPLNFVNNFSEVNSELIDEMKSELKKGNYQEVEGISNDIKENEEKIKHHGKRADAIVKSMLQHFRTSSGEKELTDINALCDEYLKLAYHGFRARDKSFNAEIKAELDPDLPKINIVPQDVGRVLLNLVNNALQSVAHAEKPQVLVATKRLEKNVEIHVIDNGPGIPEDIKDKIFQPFFTTKPTGQGTGLGLSLAYDIVKAHHGTIKIENGKDRGVEFIITLPVD